MTPRRVVLGSLLVGCLVWGAGCSGHSAGMNNNSYCHDCTDSCPPGTICVDCVCVMQDGGGRDACGPPVIQVPASLDFGNPQLGVPEARDLEIVNAGCLDLQVLQLQVVEAGARAEYSVEPAGAVNLVLGPGAGFLATVTLLQVDGEPDLGQVVVTSTDPASPEVTVDLVSGFVGAPALGICAFPEETAAPYPTAPFSQCITDSQGDPMIDFGPLDYGIPVHRVAAVYNAGSGNQPLSVTAVAISDWTCHHGAFSVELFRQDPQTGLPVSVALPAHLGAVDQAVAPDVLYARMAFDGSLGGLVHPLCELIPSSIEAGLVLESNDPGDAEAYYGFHGVICYDDISHPDCPPYCVYAGPELCGDGIDNDCDGVIDGEGALGCVWHHRDQDSDGYGDPNDSRCLCGPEGVYSTTDASDCDDDPASCGASCHPGAVELCDGLNYDNDCDTVPDAVECP